MNKIDSVFYQQLPLSPDFEFDIRVVRTQQDALYRGFGKYDLHYHSFWEIDYVICGEGVNIFENTTYPFAAGDIYIIHPYEMHNAFPDNEIELYCIQFSEDSVVRSVFSDAVYNGELAHPRFRNVVRAEDTHYAELERIVQRTLAEWKARRVGWRPAVRLCLAELFIELVRDFAVPTDRNVPATRQNRGVFQALDYINLNYTHKITLEQAAREALMNKNYFCTVFKQQMGCTYYSYVNTLRLHHACALLKSTERTVKEIALGCGFSDISSFNKAFRKAYSVSPGEYRHGNAVIVRTADSEAPSHSQDASG
ncbi:MAG: AraC family transcriptional regulator [Clostridiaceae bacterium]|nr:AraC family transcriptional regulator [Clostridiaceae bacterium]